MGSFKELKFNLYIYISKKFFDRVTEFLTFKVLKLFFNIYILEVYNSALK